MELARITRATRNGRPLCPCYTTSDLGRVIYANPSCPACKGTGGVFGNAQSESAPEPTTIRPTALRPTIPVPANGPCQGARTTILAVADEAAARAFDCNRNVLSMRATAERLRAMPVNGSGQGAPSLAGATDYWAWLAAEAEKVADLCAKAAAAENEAKAAAAKLREGLDAAAVALALIEQGAAGARGGR